ncbi:MAG: RagB/SusD family nutrient uptake outer membrane protein [Bacteroidales bacterium]|nr:RagB/SusD family nutrient uptake outer membrane protein [Bacteroidales bacterium]
MKNFYRILAAVALAVLAVSCIDLTSPTKSSFDESVVFSNYSLAENSIFGVYTAFGEQNGHRGRYLCYYGLNTDIEAYTTTTYSGGKLDIAAYDCTPGNSQLSVSKNPFASMFTGIERVNLCIQGLQKYGNIETDADMRYLLGEALVLRAVLYADLMKAYGEVPARFKPITPETIYLNKSDKDVILKQLLLDLDEAITYLPWPNGNAATTSTGRISKAFAEGLYARLALVAAGSSWRPEEGKVGTGDIGSKRFSNDEALGKDVLYPKALDYLRDCIAHSGLKLIDFEQLWRDVNNMDMTAGKEIMFAYPFSDGRGRWNYTFAVASTNKTKWIGTADKRGGDAGPLATVYYMYEPGDVRRDISCVPWHWERGTDNVDREVLNGGKTWYFGKYRFDWMTRAPYTGGNDDGIKPVYMRYADVLLMAAEIAADQGYLPEAKGYLKQVRERAFPNDIAAADAYVDALSEADFFNDIVNERALEFVGEMLRKGDLIRWGILKEKLDEARANLQALGAKEGVYAGIPDYVYYSYEEDGCTIKVYGLDKGQSDPPAGWEPFTNSEGEQSKYYSASSLLEKANTLYKEGVNPEQHMWWPIATVDLTNALGYIKNDYGY